MLARGWLILLSCILSSASLLLLLVLSFRSHGPPPAPIASPPPKNEEDLFSGYDGASCPSHATWLADLKVDPPFRYARRDIVVRAREDVKRASVTLLDGPLFPGYDDVTPGEDAGFALTKCLEPLVLDVPPWPTTYPNASHLLFGVSTSLARLEDSIPYFQRWLAYTNARLVAIVTGPGDSNPNKDDVTALQTRMRNLGIAATLVRPLVARARMEDRYFSLIKILHSHWNSMTQWAVMMDDDTFFPSMRSLISTLATFDSNEQYYLGAMSEEWWSVGRYSLMGFGGAGIFLSLPLLELLDADYKACMKESTSTAGDMRVFECISWHTDVRLTHIKGLHQIDLHGDRSGLFESGREILSLHHWKEGWWDEGNLGTDRGGHWTWFPMDTMHLVADICDTCFLQRWQFDNDTILANGYSVSSYPTGALTRFREHQGLDKTENTWLLTGQIEGSINKGFDHYVGPTRPMLKLEEEKVQYRFLDAVAVNGGVRQYYHHFGLNGELDTVVELFWIREEEYNKAKPA